MLREAALSMARQSSVRKLVLATPGMKGIAWRFVAGEDLDAGVAAVRALNRRGVKGTLNYVGWHVRDRPEAIAGADQAIDSLRRVADEDADSHISIKLTQIGLDIDEALCRAQLVRILECAAEAGVFVRIDMEESGYVQRTVGLFEEMLDRFGDGVVGIAFQSYLRTRAAELERLMMRRARIRLVKGGYTEPADVAYNRQEDIDAAFGHDVEMLLRRGHFPAIATHDPAAIDRARKIQQES